MPEITSVDAIRTKLHEFDERVSGAIAAARTLARVKDDAEKLLKDMVGISTKGEQALQKAEAIRLRLQVLQGEWESLKQEVANTQTASKETRDVLLSELDTAIQSFGKKQEEAEGRLHTINRALLSEHAELLTHLDAETRINADIATKAKSSTLGRAEEFEQHLATLRDELQGEVHAKLLHAKELLESLFREMGKELNEQSANHGRLLNNEINAFKEEMRRHLVEHQQASDLQLTAFLNKQNSLIQNLGQQIDSFNRVSQAQSTDLAELNTKINNLLSAFNAHKTIATDELATLATGMSEIRIQLTEVSARIRSHGELITALDTTTQKTSKRLSQTLDNLRQLPIVGGKFK